MMILQLNITWLLLQLISERLVNGLNTSDRKRKSNGFQLEIFENQGKMKKWTTQTKN